MAFGETKVYFDGSHYIAIPHTERPSKKRSIKIEEVITVVQEEVKDSTENAEPLISNEENSDFVEQNDVEINTELSEIKPKTLRQMTKKELFNELYSKYIDERKSQRKKLILKDMLPYFPDKKLCEIFVHNNFERKQRNLICRRIRMCRKANLANFNYFCTFTYDSNKLNEEEFREKFLNCLRHLSNRKGWKYIGVF